MVTVLGLLSFLPELLKKDVAHLKRTLHFVLYSFPDDLVVALQLQLFILLAAMELLRTKFVNTKTLRL